MPNPAAACRIAVIANQSSGTARPDRLEAAVRAAFAQTGAEIALHRATAGRDLPRLIETALRGQPDMVVAAGGDGTISAVAGRLCGTGVAMGVIPQGTFNYVARGLGIPEDPEEAAQLLAREVPRPYQVAEVNGQVFLNNASLGLYPRVLKEREDTYRRWGRSRIAAHWSVLRTFLTFHSPVRMRVLIDGVEIRARTPLAFVARSAFQLDSFGLDGADAVRDGQFALFLAPDASRWAMLRSALRLAGRGMRADRDFELFCGQEIVIETSRQVQIMAMDGERRRMAGPFRFRLLPDALQVIAPARRDALADGAADRERAA
ncbi:MAG: diacylglycerol kinase [Roseivivax sp.]|nr:diacylglycerol kinase [Roseivivax sp.]